MHLQEPEFFLVHEYCVSQETRLVKLTAPTSRFFGEATCESSTKKGLLYTPENPEEGKKGILSDWPRLLRIASMVLLSRWGRQSLEDMTSLETDFETHAIRQGYVEDPAAKDFVARKARTIALSKAQGAQQ
jgi:hypothetical protein